MSRSIGIIGGVGPYAGLDLAQKIFDQTAAIKDQEHLPVALLSYSAKIADRTPFVLGESTINPGYAIAEIILDLEQRGSSVIGIPCNTAHAPTIFNVIQEELKHKNSKVTLIHMIREVISFIQREYPGLNYIGVLSTLGTHKSGIYTDLIKQNHLRNVFPDDSTLEVVHDVIYNPEYGIKAQSNPVSEIARYKLLDAIGSLASKGAEAIILGCTELPLAFDEVEEHHCVIIDPALILARAMIQEFAPHKLKEMIVKQVQT